MRRSSLKVRRSQIAAAVAAVIGSGAASAANVSWVGANGSFWDLATNWSSNPALPGAPDDVLLGAFNTTFRSGTVAINSFNGTGIFTVTGGTLTFASASSTGGLVMSAGQLSGAGNLTVSAASTLNSRCHVGQWHERASRRHDDQRNGSAAGWWAHLPQRRHAHADQRQRRPELAEPRHRRSRQRHGGECCRRYVEQQRHRQRQQFHLRQQPRRGRHRRGGGVHQPGHLQQAGRGHHRSAHGVQQHRQHQRAGRPVAVRRGRCAHAQRHDQRGQRRGARFQQRRPRHPDHQHGQHHHCRHAADQQRQLRQLHPGAHHRWHRHLLAELRPGHRRQPDAGPDA